jgi:hypothetical protein
VTVVVETSPGATGVILAPAAAHLRQARVDDRTEAATAGLARGIIRLTD